MVIDLLREVKGCIFICKKKVQGNTFSRISPVADKGTKPEAGSKPISPALLP